MCLCAVLGQSQNSAGLYNRLPVLMSKGLFKKPYRTVNIPKFPIVKRYGERSAHLRVEIFQSLQEKSAFCSSYSKKKRDQLNCLE